MSDSACITIAYVVRAVYGIALTCACYAVLSTFLWAWLAAVLAFIASCLIERTAPVQAVEALTYDFAVAGATKLAGIFGRIAAKVSA